LSTNTNLSIIQSLQAEALLGNNWLIQQAKDLHNGIRYHSTEDEVSFYEFYENIAKDVQELPKLKLDASVPAGTEAQYLDQLATAFGEIQDRVQIVVDKLLFFKSKLKSAGNRCADLRAAFNAWYMLAATEILNQHNLKFPNGTIKALADSEFSRLLQGLDADIEAIMEMVDAKLEQIKSHKKLCAEKYKIGQDQANNSWQVPHRNSWGGDNSLLSDPRNPRPDEEEEEPEPEEQGYVSKLKPKETTEAAAEPDPSVPRPGYLPPLDTIDLFGTKEKKEEAPAKPSGFRKEIVATVTKPDTTEPLPPAEEEMVDMQEELERFAAEQDEQEEEPELVMDAPDVMEEEPVEESVVEEPVVSEIPPAPVQTLTPRKPLVFDGDDEEEIPVPEKKPEPTSAPLSAEAMKSLSAGSLKSIISDINKPDPKPQPESKPQPKNDIEYVEDDEEGVPVPTATTAPAAKPGLKFVEDDETEVF
jgi:hypothetical protein